MSAPQTAAADKSPPPISAIHQLELATNDAIAPIIREARSAWRRDLPTLLMTNSGQWVAYHGERQVAIGRRKTELFQRCLNAGLHRGEFLVLRIEPETEHDVDVPLDI